MVAWVRRNDGTANREQPPITMGHAQVPDFFKPFNKLEGLRFNGEFISVWGVEDWKIDQKWHHVAISFGPNQGKGRFQMWIDGVLYGYGGNTFTTVGYPSWDAQFLQKQL